MSLKLYSPRTAMSPWREFETLANRLGGLMDEPVGSAWTPAVSVTEDAEAVMITAEVPGITPEALTVELDNNVLTISGEKLDTREETDEKTKFHLWERRFGTFSRSFRLPRTVDADAIDASFDNGILTVRLPKAAEAKSRTIEVKS